MYCYLVRHGQDDETVRGGWSQMPLSLEGVRQVEALAEKLSAICIGSIYSSDLQRAVQTADILANRLHTPVAVLADFREVNNGELAGMKNALALHRYPGLFWNQMGWEQSYPNGESPKQFYERITAGWERFTKQIADRDENVMLVTHTGVIQVILAIISGKCYRNTDKQRHIGYAECITLEFDGYSWHEICPEMKGL